MAAKRRNRKKGGKRAKSLPSSRRLARRIGFALLAVLAAWAAVSCWYVHHPREWLAARNDGLPRFVTVPLLFMGNPVADVTDGLGWTGHDAVYEYDIEAPSGETLFAGAPVRIGEPAPDDIKIVDRGDFVFGWSDRLRHPVWCAYHVVRDARYEIGKRPSFRKDREIPAAPAVSAYTKSGYDRGHLAPNHAMATRYGPDVQRATFAMSNVAPQTPQLNRGVWRDIEHRIADFWTARYGEIWVVVGSISPKAGGETIAGTGIDVPEAFYQVIVAQEGMDVRALAVLIPQSVPWGAWAARHIVSIEELERLTGLDFNPDLPGFIQRPLESDVPSRLWPVRLRDIFRLIALRFL